MDHKEKTLSLCKSIHDGQAVLYCGDCIEVMSSMQEQSVDFIVTDPPYGCSTTVITRNQQKDLNSNFGGWDVFFTDWLQEAFRVLKQNSGMVIFVPATKFESLMNKCISVGLEYVQPWFYHKKNPTISMRNVLQWSVEHMIYVRKGSHKLNIKNRGRCHNLFSHAIPSKKEGRFHPTQKPISLMLEIIRYVSNEGDVILDPFNGSGTTGLAAIAERCRYVGIELNDAYFNKSCSRIKHWRFLE